VNDEFDISNTTLGITESSQFFLWKNAMFAGFVFMASIPLDIETEELPIDRLLADEPFI
jgi:hypothetical protein